MVATPKKSTAKTPKKTQLLSPQSIRQTTRASSRTPALSIDGVTFRKKPKQTPQHKLHSPNSTQIATPNHSSETSNYAASRSTIKRAPVSPQSIRNIPIRQNPQQEVISSLIESASTVDQHNTSTTQQSPELKAETVVPFFGDHSSNHLSENESSTHKKRSHEESNVTDSTNEAASPPSKNRKSNHEKREPLLSDSPENTIAIVKTGSEPRPANTPKQKASVLLKELEFKHLRKKYTDAITQTQPKDLKNLFSDNQTEIQGYLDLTSNAINLLDQAYDDQTIENWLAVFKAFATLCNITNTTKTEVLNTRLCEAHNDCINVFKELKKHDENHPLIIEFFQQQAFAKKELEKIQDNPSNDNADDLHQAKLLVQALCGHEEHAQPLATTATTSTERMQTRSWSNFFGWGNNAKTSTAKISQHKV